MSDLKNELAEGIVDTEHQFSSEEQHAYLTQIQEASDLFAVADAMVRMRGVNKHADEVHDRYLSRSINKMFDIAKMFGKEYADVVNDVQKVTM